MRKNIYIDEYLVSRGWKFAKAETTNDSTETSYWLFQDAHKKQVAEFLFQTSRNQSARVSYSIINRSYFSAIKARVNAYQMTYLQERNNNQAVWTYYRGAKYDVSLAVYAAPNTTDATWYGVTVERHGLIRWVFGAPGSPEWLTPQQLELELQQREAEGDSLTRSMVGHQ